MANKGEWSEVYAFFKLLAEGKLYSADGHLNLIHNQFTPILEIFRDDSPNRNGYKINAAKKMILAVGETIHLDVPQKKFQKEAERLLELIKSSDKKEDNFDDTLMFMKEIQCGGISAKSTDKADIRIVIHRLADGTTPELGYSIKSKLGGNSTLINSNHDNSNFIFRIDGINDMQMRQFNYFDKFKKKFEYLESIGASWKFVKVSQNILRNNLNMLDLGMAQVIGSCLGKYYSGEGNEISELCRKVAVDDPLHILNGTSQPMYEYKIKQFLLAFALGMTVSSEWNGTFNANGGYIVVKEDGDIACYHFFDRNELEEYLFYNTAFDTPSTTRHQFGDIYKEDGFYYLKLNLQVRFKK